MIAYLRPFPRTRTAEWPACRHPRRNGWAEFPFAGTAVGMAFGFLTFMPYPGVPVGDNTGVQLGSLLTLVVVIPCLFSSWRDEPYFLAPLLLAPLSLSLFKVALTDGAQLDLCFKSLVMTGLSALTLLAAQRTARSDGLALLTGMATAAIVHAAVGFWQLYSFPRGEFPLLGLYVNPSFLSVQDNAEVIVEYIRRPFGLFPEPSAMSSALAPWVVFWTAHAFGLVRLRQAAARWQRGLFAVATCGALGLIIASRSGHSAVLVLALAIVSVAWLLRSRATVGRYLAIVLVFVTALPLAVWLAAAALADRVGLGAGVADASLYARAHSIQAGLSLVEDGSAATWAFGIGPGLTSPAMLSSTGFQAVWSVLLPYLYQTGLCGAAAVGAVAYYLLLRIWRASQFSVAFATMLFVWLVGVTITTSYGQLLPLWVALAWLSVWPKVCLPPVPERPLNGSRAHPPEWANAANLRETVRPRAPGGAR